MTMWRHLLDYPVIKKSVLAHEQLQALKIAQKMPQEIMNSTL